MSSPSHVVTGLSDNGFYQHTFTVIVLNLTYKVHGQDTMLMEYIILMCFTEVQQHSPLLIVNMTTEIIRTCML